MISPEKRKMALLFSMFLFFYLGASGAVAQPNPDSATTYCNGFNHDSYTDYLPLGTWHNNFEKHALTWKHLVNPDLGFNLPTGSAWYEWDVDLGAGEQLNFHESTEGGRFFDPATGTPVDPVGSWSEVLINDPATAAIFSAIAIWAWDTTVYFNFDELPTTAQGIEPFSSAAVVHCVTLSVDSPKPPHVVCGWTAGSGDEMLKQAMTCPGLTVEHLEMSYFTGIFWDNTGAEYVEKDPKHPEIDGELFSMYYNYAFGDSYVLFDPPGFDTLNPLSDPMMLLELSEVLGRKAKLRRSTRQ